jgi:predicted GTPase
MSRWRVAIVVLLFALPVAVLAGVGGYRIWQTGYSFTFWWPMAACFGLGYFLAWHWLRKKELIEPVDFNAPMHWTDRDREAWKLVEERAKKVAQMELLEFNELQFYMTMAQEMALELARFYRPKAQDPFGELRVPEILAVVELAARDLADMVDRNVPGGHLLTVSEWRWAKDTATQATQWYRAASNVYWLVAAVVSPLETGLRYAASQVGMAKPMQLFQQDLIAWFHTAYVHRLGTYLIDLYSGRLRVGARRYLELKHALQSAGDAAAPPQAVPVGPSPVSTSGEAPPMATIAPAPPVTLTIVGQVKAGKSSLVNAILGEQRARTDVLPATAEVTKYELKLPDTTGRLLLLDTVGYGHTGPKEDQLRVTEDCARQSDLLLLGVHARNPARQADVMMLQKLREWFAARPDVKMPPVVAVLTQIDLLAPAMEWQPPYNWRKPERLKEEQIAEAVAATREQLGDLVTAVVPVCVAAGKVFGVEEELLPELVRLLGEARAVALLRYLRAEADAGKVRKVFEQFLAIGLQAAKVWLGPPVHPSPVKPPPVKTP